MKVKSGLSSGRQPMLLGPRGFPRDPQISLTGCYHVSFVGAIFEFESAAAFVSLPENKSNPKLL